MAAGATGLLGEFLAGTVGDNGPDLAITYDGLPACAVESVDEAGEPIGPDEIKLLQEHAN